MALTFGNYKALVKHTIGAEPEGIYSDFETTKGIIVNQAFDWLFDMHDWSWRTVGPYPVNYVGTITISDATYTESTKTITDTGAFADYTYRPGDTVEITAGTGATTGVYRVAGKTDDNNITLAESIGSGADGQTDIDGTLDTPYFVFPTNFGELLFVESDDGRSNTVMETTLAQLEAIRHRSYTGSSNIYYAAISYPSQTSTTVNAGNPVAEIWPAPSADDQSAAWITYKKRHVYMTSDSQIPDIQVWLEPLASRVVKAFALEHEDERDDALNQVYTSAAFLAATERDGRTQRNIGRVGGGVLTRRAPVLTRWWGEVIQPS